MISIVIWTIIYSLLTAVSIALLGDRNLISGDLYKIGSLLKLIIHWKFAAAFILAISARASFVIINNMVLKFPAYEHSATTITAFASSVAFIFVILVNYILLDEKLTLQQSIGAVIVIAGIWLMME